MIVNRMGCCGGRSAMSGLSGLSAAELLTAFIGASDTGSAFLIASQYKCDHPGTYYSDLAVARTGAAGMGLGKTVSLIDYVTELILKGNMDPRSSCVAGNNAAQSDIDRYISYGKQTVAEISKATGSQQQQQQQQNNAGAANKAKAAASGGLTDLLSTRNLAIGAGLVGVFMLARKKKSS